MRRRITDNLYVGDLEDCRALSRGSVGKDWAVVHACKNPCHADRCGQAPDPESADYLARQEGAHLYLNMIDPPAPLFRRATFDIFIRFAREQWQAGRPLLIHCNRGESRAPSLAIVFLAKVLYRIGDTSFDDAWDEFEQLIGEKFQPGAGIEQWLREHWRELDGGPRLPSLDGAAEAAPEPLPDLALPEDSDSCEELCRAQPLFHFSGFVQIEGKAHTWFTPVPNALQFDMAEAYDWCIENEIPCRLLILKPRQVGCSTFCAELCYHHMRRFHSDMLVMGDVSKRTEKVYGIFNDYSTHDAFQWDSRYQFNTEKGRFTYADGSEGLVEHDTALDPKAGISGTRQVLWLTEAARYMKSKGRDKLVITAVLNSLANVPKSLALAESTAEGASGWFYETHQGAVSLEERRRGIVGNGWIKVFAAWFEFTEHQLPRTAGNVEYFREGLDDRERRGIALYGWTAEQIAWRRMKIAKDCANDVRMFDQDFPEDAESCFLASGRPRFNMEAITRMETAARVTHGLADTGTLERGTSGEIQFLPRADGESWLWVAERPTFGCRYIGFIDPCTGEQSEGSAFPDAHAPGIIRAGYMERDRWVPPRLVAAIDVPTGCRWDDELIADRMVRLLDWYGGCMIVPETGNGLGVLNELRRAGANVYQREKMDAMYPGQRLKVAGWETNKDTRPLVVNAMANALREQSFDCSYLPAINEMKTFVINDRGKAEAKSGCHDDWVMGIGIGLQCIEKAQAMMPPQLFAPPEDSLPAALPGGLVASAFS